MNNAIALFVALPICILVAAFIVMATKSRRHDVSDFDAPSLRENKLLWGVTFAVALIYLVAGVPKLGEMGLMVNQFQEWGYSEDFMWMIGALEMAGAILLLFKRTAWLSATGLSILAGGSIYTHLANGEYLLMLVPTAVFAGLVFIAFQRFPVEAFSRDSESSKSSSSSEENDKSEPATA